MDPIMLVSDRERLLKYREAMNDNQKHVNESCTSCDKPIDFDEWFCYCSLCLDCYMQTPEEELERIQEELEELTGNKAKH
jgi:hypothetical protein